MNAIHPPAPPVLHLVAVDSNEDFGAGDAIPPSALAPEVQALFDMCLCGHDRGEHLVEAPHACEAHDGGCGCPFFLLEAKRDTEPPAADATIIDALAPAGGAA